MDIHVDGDMGAACIYNDIAFARIREETSTGIPASNIIGGFDDYQFLYDDLGREEGTHHREWSACEMAIAHLSENYREFNNSKPTSTTWDDPMEYTVPSIGVVRIWTGSGGVRTILNGVENLPWNGNGSGQYYARVFEVKTGDIIQAWRYPGTGPGELVFLPKNY